MVFEVRDYYDFVRLLYQHPEWREELGNLLIAQEIRELPQIVRELAEAQKRSEERLSGVEERVARLETAVAELAEAQKRSEERLTRLEQVVAELAEAQKRTDEQLQILTQRVDALTQRMNELTQRVDKLGEKQERLTVRVGELSDYMLEGRYRQRPLAYFGRLLAQAQVVEVNEVIPEENDLTEDELQELLVLDVLLQGRLRPSFAERLGVSDVWLAVEVSGQIEYPDVDRAWRRAALLKRCGLRPVLGVVGGQEITKNAENAARQKGVLMELEHQLVNLDDVLISLRPGQEIG